MTHKILPTSQTNPRRRGYVAIMVALAWLVLCGFAALSFDLSRMYTRKAEAQKAADAAALAGAYGESVLTGNGTSQALTYAKANGYDTGAGAKPRARVKAGPDTAEAGLYRVTLSRPEPIYFARIFFGPTMDVYATAAAEYTQKADVPVQNYGKSDGPISLSVFGPNAYKYNGDPYSVKFMSAQAATDDKPNNPDYQPGGYTFNVLPVGGISDYAKANLDPLTGKALMQIEIFDPGTGNTAGTNAQQGVAVDEIRRGWKGPLTTLTEYTLTYDNGTPGDSSDDIVEKKSFGSDSTDGTDMKWDKTFQLDLADSKYQKTNGKFSLNVKAVDGSSENGFNLRAGPAYTETLTDDQWISKYGKSVAMSGKGSLPLNFNNNGVVEIDFGAVPALPKGGQLKIRKFDVDVLAPGTTYNRVDYTDGNLSFTGSTVVGSAANGVWQEDKFTLPVNYSGGTWKATYNAGTNDTSAWEMIYPGPENIRLVR